MAKLTSLIVDMQANTAALRKGMDEATGIIQKFGKQAATAGKAVAAMFAFAQIEHAIVKLGEFVHAGAEAADATGKAAQAAGVGVEAYSRLSYAANEVEISNEELSKSLNKLNKFLGAAAAGGSSQISLFKAMGIAFKDSTGHLRSADQIMADVAEKFSHMADGAAKSALANELFGKSGARLIPLLNKGRDGLREMGEEADKFGFTVTKQGAAAAEEFDQSLIKMKKIMEGLGRTVAQDLAPAMASLADEFLKEAKSGDTFALTAKGIATVLRGLVISGVVVAGVFQHVGVTLAGLASAIYDFTAGDFKGVKSSLKQMAEEIGKNFDTVAARVKAVLATGDDRPFKEEQKASGEDADKVIADAARKSKAMEDYKAAVEKVHKTLRDLQLQAQTFGLGEVETMKWRIAVGDLSEELDKMGKAGVKAAVDIMKAIEELDSKKTKKIGESVKRRAEDAGGRVVDLDETAGDRGFATNRAQPIAPRGLAAGTDLRAAAFVVDKQIAAAAKFNQQVGEAVAALGNGIANGVKHALSGLLGAMGGIGNIIGNFIQTFQSEGFWEAVIGAIGEIIAAAPAFADVVSIAAGILKYIVGALDGLIGAIGTLLGALGSVIEIIINALAPLFDGLAQFLTDLAPILFIIGETLKVSITPLAKALGSAFKALSPVLKILFDVIKGIVLFSFYILRALGNAWNGIVGAISGFLRMIGNITLLGGKPFAALLDWADSVDKAKITMVGLENSIKELEDASYETAQAQQNARTEEYKAAGATEKTAKAMNDVTRASAGLTNIPALLKVNRLRGMAMDSSQEINVYIDGKQILTTVVNRYKQARFNKDGSRTGF